jgi:hypothetical protein
MVVTPEMENDMKYLLPILLILAIPIQAAAELHVVIIQGLGGNQEYAKRFAVQTERLERAATNLTGMERVKIFRDAAAGREQISGYFAELAGRTGAEDRIAVFLIGHGSYDGFEYKFNIPGPDLTGEDLAAMMNALPSNNQLLVNTSSASGAIMESMKHESRIVITATRSGNERNATRFGGFFAAALNEPSADTNKNNSISVKEAFDYAEKRVAYSFEDEGTLATEHPRITGNRLAEYQLARFEDQLPVSADPRLAAIMRQRDNLDSKILELQLNRETMANDEYFSRLQQLMIEMALLDGEIEDLGGTATDAP